MKKKKREGERDRETGQQRKKGIEDTHLFMHKCASQHFLNHRTFKQRKCILIRNGPKRVFPYIGWTGQL